MNGTIYLITNTINGKKYIGQTTQSITTRLREHARNTYNKSIIAKALRKYGMDCFIVQMLDTNITTKEQLNVLEKLYIQAYNTVVPNGYNLTLGGEGANKLPKLSKDVQQEIVIRYCAGESSTTLGKEYGVDHHTIVKYLRAANITINGSVIEKQALAPDIEQQVLLLYYQNKLNKEISVLLCIGRCTVTRILRRHNLKSHYMSMDKRGPRKNK